MDILKRNIFMVLLFVMVILLGFMIKTNIEYKKKLSFYEKRFIPADCSYIVDSQPDSFKEFILHNNTADLLKKLYKNLDEDSIKVIESNLLKILHLPDVSYAKYYLIDKETFEKDFVTKTGRNINKAAEYEKKELDKKYKIADGLSACPYVIWSQLNLRFANDKLKEYIKNKVFIDGGANIGDSTLAVLDFQPKKIYAFDLLDININNYKKIMELNKVPKDKYEIYRMAIAGKKAKYKISSTNIMGGIYESEDETNKDIFVESIDIDSFMRDKEGRVGLIHGDLQGAMCEAIIGMRETIKRDRPVLSLDISNSPQEFFLAKPILDDIVKDLNYKIKIIDYDNMFPLTTIGLTIWAYPKELDDDLQ